nr:hypothetical protein Iba_chr14bCG0320 [Ipomoea batatas]
MENIFLPKINNILLRLHRGQGTVFLHLYSLYRIYPATNHRVSIFWDPFHSLDPKLLPPRLRAIVRESIGDSTGSIRVLFVRMPRVEIKGANSAEGGRQESSKRKRTQGDLVVSHYLWDIVVSYKLQVHHLFQLLVLFTGMDSGLALKRLKDSRGSCCFSSLRRRSALAWLTSSTLHSSDVSSSPHTSLASFTIFSIISSSCFSLMYVPLYLAPPLVAFTLLISTCCCITFLGGSPDLNKPGPWGPDGFRFKLKPVKLKDPIPFFDVL